MLKKQKSYLYWRKNIIFVIFAYYLNTVLNRYFKQIKYKPYLRSYECKSI